MDGVMRWPKEFLAADRTMVSSLLQMDAIVSLQTRHSGKLFLTINALKRSLAIAVQLHVLIHFVAMAEDSFAYRTCLRRMVLMLPHMRIERCRLRESFVAYHALMGLVFGMVLSMLSKFLGIRTLSAAFETMESQFLPIGVQ